MGEGRDWRKEGRKGGKGREGEGKGGGRGTCSKVLGGIDAPGLKCFDDSRILFCINKQTTADLSRFESYPNLISKI